MEDMFENLEEGECIDIFVTEAEGRDIPESMQRELKASVCRVSENELRMDMPGEENDYSMKFKKRKL